MNAPVTPNSATPEVTAGPGAATTDGPTLAAVRDRGRLNCGVLENVPGFASRDLLGQWRGFDVDFCRAVAAAVFGDARQVRIVPLEARTRYNALQANQVDLIPRGGWTFTRDAGWGLDFVGISYYDRQGVMAPKALNLSAIDGLTRRTVCVQAPANASKLVDRFAATPETRRPRSLPFDTDEEAFEAYRNGQCQAIAGEISFLSAERATLRNPEDHVVLPEAIAKEPQGPVVRQNDPQWADIVRWSLNAMILAEELGVTSDTVVGERSQPKSTEIANLLSGDGYGQMLLLRDDWAFKIISQVGNYGEVFDRNLGPRTPLALERGQNALWNAETPGLLFSPPMR